MKRTLAQLIYIEGRLHRQAILVEHPGGSLAVERLVAETAMTEFFNGLIALVPEGTSVPASVMASEAVALAENLPQPAATQPAIIVRIPFASKKPGDNASGFR